MNLAQLMAIRLTLNQRVRVNFKRNNLKQRYNYNLDLDHDDPDKYIRNKNAFGRRPIVHFRIEIQALKMFLE